MEREILRDIKWSRGKTQGILVVKDKRKLECIEKALQRQIFFENEVSEIREWFLNNKDCLNDSAVKVAEEGFELLTGRYKFITKTSLEFITENIVDEMQKGIINVLDTFGDN